jgi:hypothetical protein
MDPKKIRLIAVAAGIPIVLVALVSILGSGGEPVKTGPVVVTKGSGDGSATGTARPSSTAIGLTLEDLVKGTPARTGDVIVTPTLPPADPKAVADLMDKGERAYMSGDLASARGYFDRARKLDPACARCQQKLELLEAKMLKEIQDAFRAGEGYLQDGRYDQAVWALERVFALDPDPKSQYHENANTLIQEAKTKKAQSGR